MGLTLYASLGGLYGFWDPTYWMIIVGGALSLLASAKVKSTYRKYSTSRNRAGITGAQAAQRILEKNGILDVSIQQIQGNLTDHYDPKNKVLRLSTDVYQSTSVAAVGVAAHECGHAIQHQKAYYPLHLRSAFVPVARFGSAISWPMIIVGFLLGGATTGGTIGGYLIQIGIAFFSLAVIFQLITLPVEFNASKRALVALDTQGILTSEELKGTKKVLGAAALTYVAGAAAAILQLLRLLYLFGGRSRD